MAHGMRQPRPGLVFFSATLLRFFEFIRAIRGTGGQDSGMRIILFLTLFGVALAEEPTACVFCEIVAGTRQQEGIVYRDDQVMAFLGLGPRNPGHVLVIPLRHADNFLTVPAETMHAMTDAAKKIAEAFRRTDLKAEGFVLQMNTGRAAGQSVFHAHLHLIPRFAGELPEKTPRDRVPLSELAPVAAKIRAALATPPPAQQPQGE